MLDSIRRSSTHLVNHYEFIMTQIPYDATKCKQKSNIRVEPTAEISNNSSGILASELCSGDNEMAMMNIYKQQRL